MSVPRFTLKRGPFGGWRIVDEAQPMFRVRANLVPAGVASAEEHTAFANEIVGALNAAERTKRREPGQVACYAERMGDHVAVYNPRGVLVDREPLDPDDTPETHERDVLAALARAEFVWSLEEMSGHDWTEDMREGAATFIAGPPPEWAETSPDFARGWQAAERRAYAQGVVDSLLGAEDEAPPQFSAEWECWADGWNDEGAGHIPAAVKLRARLDALDAAETFIRSLYDGDTPHGAGDVLAKIEAAKA